MKRLLALFMAIAVIFSANTFVVFAEDTQYSLIYSEDFSDYTTEGEMPDGWHWTSVPDNVIEASVNPAETDNGNGTAMKIRAHGENTSYIGATIDKTDITKGVLKLSFQIYFENIPESSSSSQTIQVYGGDKTPYIKGLRIDDGIVKYPCYDTDRWTTAFTTAFLLPQKWYTFDIVSDIDNKKVTYFMNGKPLIDEKTGKNAESPTYVNSTTSISQIQILARTHHTGAQFGGDVLVDNVSLSRTTVSGATASIGNKLTENPTEFDIMFNNSINLAEFSADEVTVNKYSYEDIMLSDGTPVNFTLKDLTNVGCKIDFGEAVDLENYDRIVVDFGNNKDFTGNRISSFTAIKEVPGEVNVVYDSETAGSYPIEMQINNFTESDFSYTSG